MQPRSNALAALTLAAALAASAFAAEAPALAAPAETVNQKFDAALAAQVGADDYGMRNYVLVVLKTGPKPMPQGPDRDAMFKGHFANMKRLSDEGKLAFAGPFDDENWRGLFIFAVPEIEEARKLVATDPVVASGEMVPEFHKLYGSAALMLVPAAHDRVRKMSF
jgi:uncharacterized protein YciI